ncbi:hypothetical protein C8R45DRAFT_941679 [Mycena sanguinolenta]|nr:hypothetical protein C8R45DRAFT_941679 [Mycena sanguinolenta]
MLHAERLRRAETSLPPSFICAHFSKLQFDTAYNAELSISRSPPHGFGYHAEKDDNICFTFVSERGALAFHILHTLDIMVAFAIIFFPASVGKVRFRKSVQVRKMAEPNFGNLNPKFGSAFSTT